MGYIRLNKTLYPPYNADFDMIFKGYTHFSCYMNSYMGISWFLKKNFFSLGLKPTWFALDKFLIAVSKTQSPFLAALVSILSSHGFKSPLARSTRRTFSSILATSLSASTGSWRRLTSICQLQSAMTFLTVSSSTTALSSFNVSNGRNRMA